MSIKDLSPTDPQDSAFAGLGANELRELKLALLACFPGLDGLVQNSGASGDPGDTDPPDAATFSNLFDNVRTLQTAGNVPIGFIGMWSGVVADIPEGWGLCDGGTYNATATPDLRDRFIVGAGDLGDGSNFDPTDKGGNSWVTGGNAGRMQTDNGGDGTFEGTITIPDHTLTVDNIPEHSHKMFGGSGTNGEPTGSEVVASASSSGAAYDMVPATTQAEPVQGRTGKYGVSSVVPLSHGGASAEITDIDHRHEFAPRYFSLAFIMFVGVAEE